MKINTITGKIEERIPLSWCEEWDNSGLTLGETASDVSRVALALDATERAVAEATSLGCGLLVTHHPVIFKPVTKITDSSLSGSALLAAARRGVALYSVHTNWDSSPEGVNVVLAGLAGLCDISPLTAGQPGAWGMGAVGSAETPMTVLEIAELVKSAWGLSSVVVHGNNGAEISRVAICGGAGGSLVGDAKEAGAEVFVTADLSYHHILDARYAGISVISAAHGEMERASLPALRALIEEATSLEATIIDDSNPVPIFVL
jgi:dinuclear metal center YbgI/SA1388 family protein